MTEVNEEVILTLLDEIDNEKEKMRMDLSADICDRIDALLDKIRDELTFGKTIEEEESVSIAPSAEE